MVYREREKSNRGDAIGRRRASYRRPATMYDDSRVVVPRFAFYIPFFSSHTVFIGNKAKDITSFVLSGLDPSFGGITRELNQEGLFKKEDKKGLGLP